MERIQQLRAAMESQGIEAFFSLSPPTNQYLTEFQGSTSALVVTLLEGVFLCDFRYTELAREQVRALPVEEVSGDLVVRTAERLAKHGVQTAAFDPSHLTVAQMNALRPHYSGALREAPDLVANLRMRKSAEEVDRVRAAARVTDAALANVLEFLERGSPDVSERELAARIDYVFCTLGADGPAFDTIVLFGPRSSQPHGHPASPRLRPGDIVLVDLGCRLNGYCADLTRTCVFATIPGAWFEEIYHVVLAAQQAALDAVRPGVMCREVDAAARDLIRNAGYGPQFGHGLGHGAGIEVHEGPRLNLSSDTVLESGMIVTIEPGVYLPGRGGVRIEDLVVVTPDGCEILTQTPKELRILQR